MQQTPPRKRRRAIRIAVNVLLVPAWVLVAFVSINSWERYTEVGSLTLLALIMFFALWAWWYDEDRHRRGATAPPETVNGDGPPAADPPVSG